MLFQVFTNAGVTFIIRLFDNAIIPVDQENKDYRNYLNWVAAGGPLIWDYSS